MAKKDLEATDDLRASIAHVDQASAPIARLAEGARTTKQRLTNQPAGDK